jgi:hypothetical protein
MVEKRGRKSAADRESADVVPLVLPEPPAPPPDLSPRAAQAWRDATAVMPPNHFDAGKQQVLIGYCHHVVAADLTWAMYQRALETPGTPAKELNKLARMHSRETDGIRHSARHLGLLTVARRARPALRYAPTPTPTPWPWEG